MTWLLFAIVPAIALCIALFNLATWRRGDPNAHIGGSVSVLIPARNEERNIGRALSSIPKAACGVEIREILVYDDKSTDATPLIVQRWKQTDARIQLLRGSSLPPGWVGKPHALSRLAKAARGDFLLFMDADVELKPSGLNRLLSLTLKPIGARVVTAMPEQVTGSFFERLVLPLLLLTYLSWLPLRLVELGRNPRTVAANGQLLLLRRSDLQTLGGFAAIRNQIVDDVAFCRHAKKEGMKVVFADGTLMARCRMYSGARETIDGFSKNIYEGVGGKVGTLAAIFLYIYAFFLPYGGMAAAAFYPEKMASVLIPASMGTLANLGLQAIVIGRYRQPLVGLVLHPLSILAFVGIALNSFRWHTQERVVWSGRSYESMDRRLARGLSAKNDGFTAPSQKETAQ